MPASEKITSVRVHTAPMALSWLTDSLIASPMSRYAEYRERRATLVRRNDCGCRRNANERRPYRVSDTSAEGGAAVAQEIVDTHFASLLMGKSPFQVELIWDQLYQRIDDVWPKRRGARSNQRGSTSRFGI